MNLCLYESKTINLYSAGGTLVYSTCTANPEENEQMVAWALENLQCIDQVWAGNVFFMEKSLRKIFKKIASSALFFICFS